MVQVAEPARISRETLTPVEQGDAGTSLGVLVRVLAVKKIQRYSPPPAR